MAHRLTFRLGTGCAALLFAATSGVTGMQMHPLSAHPEPEAVLAMEMGLDAPMAQMPAGHMADGAYWQSEPDTFDFHDDKLYLFWGDHAKDPFVADWELNIERANASWVPRRPGCRARAW